MLLLPLTASSLILSHPLIYNHLRRLSGGVQRPAQGSVSPPLSSNSHCLETCVWRMQTSAGHRTLDNFLCGWSTQKVREIMYVHDMKSIT